MMIGRRQFLGGIAAFVLMLATRWRSAVAAEGEFPFKMSNAEWKKKLEPEVYHVMREKGTERAFTSPLYEEKRSGSYLCAGCEQLLFSSDNKFESGTGWPSFWKPADEKAVGTETDYKIGYPRTEVHCANCGGHLGHVFEDGPEPTGLRYCINGVCLKFVPIKS